MARRHSGHPKILSSWHFRFPQSQQERHEVRKKCSSKCFGSDEEGRLVDPICQYRSTQHGPKHITCEIDAAGCKAALARERMNRNEERLQHIRKKCKATLAREESQRNV
jgi:hypothetical protein